MPPPGVQSGLGAVAPPILETHLRLERSAWSAVRVALAATRLLVLAFGVLLDAMLGVLLSSPNLVGLGIGVSAAAWLLW